MKLINSVVSRNCYIEERARIEKAKAERREKLMARVEAWRSASEIRAYVEAQMARWSDADPETIGRVRTWAEWARAEADAIDPLRGQPPVLDTYW